MLTFWLLAVIIALFYYYAIRPMSYWRRKGVISEDGYWLFGSQLRVLFNLESSYEMLQRVYQLAPNARYIGMYELTTPVLMIKDPKLLKQITVKEFDHFANHKAVIPEGADSLWSNNLLSLKDERWKEIRAVLSPSFTSSKMKMMFDLMSECSKNLVQHFSKINEDIIEINTKDATSRFANDIIASTAFGVSTDSLNNPNDEFYSMAGNLTNFTLWANLKVIGFVFMPKLLKLLKANVFYGPARRFFIDIIESTIKAREERKIKRPDMLNLLLQAKNGDKNKDEIKSKHESNNVSITNGDIISHALVFFLGGFDSVSNTMCFIAYELARNLEVQKRLREEIDQGFEECNGNLTYEAVMQMKYFDMVISEGLRKWPNFPESDRECSKDFVIEPESPDEEPLNLKRGMVVSLPTMCMHKDPKYFPDPERFDPERFNDENKDKIDPYTYFPFGLGPRNCIGSRFATLEMKVLFAYLLHHFEIVPVGKTEIPAQLKKRTLEGNLQLSNGMPLGLKPIKKIM
uniref:Cytochrome P450 9e2-like n=1 Tax=Diabrotica virgifera virgifera TaxID=50390 RepID=A0A6P7H0G8_DIAVI